MDRGKKPASSFSPHGLSHSKMSSLRWPLCNAQRNWKLKHAKSVVLPITVSLAVSEALTPGSRKVFKYIMGMTYSGE